MVCLYVKFWENLTFRSYRFVHSPVTCSQFALGNPKTSFFNIIFHYTPDCLRYLKRKQIATIVLQIQLFTYCCLVLSIICIAVGLVLRLGHATGGVRVWYGHVAACGSGMLRHGLNFSTAWCTMRLINVEKDRKRVLTQKLVTLNTFCDIACLTFQLSHVTTGSFQSHRWQPTTCSFQSLQSLKERDKPSVRWKSLQFTSWCGGIFRWGGQVDYNLFSSEIT